MAINIAYEKARQKGDPLSPPDGSDPRINPQGNAYANSEINRANLTFGAITSGLREANEAARRRIDSQTEGQVQEAQDFEFKSQNFARAQLGKIGGFEGTYGIGLQNSIAARTEKNIQSIRRAGEEAKAAGDMDLAGRLSELGLQQMSLIAQLNQQAFERTKFDTEFGYKKERDLVSDQQYKEQQALLGKDFTQLDNGDYGYFDIRTGKFVKLGHAPAPRSGGGGSLSVDELAGLPKGFTAAAAAGRSELEKGIQWGPVWNRIKAQFPTVSNEQIDTFLGGSAGSEGYFEAPTGRMVGQREATGFARPGAFEQFKRSQLAGTYDTTPTGVEISAAINRAIAEDPEEWAKMNAEQRTSFIQGMGGSPDDYRTQIYSNLPQE